jgi:peptide/nickel transport system permease protein
MATIDYDLELRRAGVHATGGWRRVLFLAQRRSSS